MNYLTNEKKLKKHVYELNNYLIYQKQMRHSF